MKAFIWIGIVVLCLNVSVQVTNSQEQYYCQIKKVTKYYCGGREYDKPQYCIQTNPNRPMSPNNPCGGLKAGDYICHSFPDATPDLSLFSYDAVVNDYEQAYQSCLNTIIPGKKNSCCQRACTTPECLCPVKCDGPNTAFSRSVDALTRNISYFYCYDMCTSCPSKCDYCLGREESWCDANSGKIGADFAVKGATNCCNLLTSKGSSSEKPISSSQVVTSSVEDGGNTDNTDGTDTNVGTSSAAVLSNIFSLF